MHRTEIIKKSRLLWLLRFLASRESGPYWPTLGQFLFCLNASPINPRTTKTAPATINQCGYSIAYSRRVIISTPFSRAALNTIFRSGCFNSSSATLKF